MKMRWKKIIGIALASVMAAGCLAGCGRNSASGDKELLFYILAGDGKDTSWVLSEVNNIVKEKTGYTVDFQVLSQDNYDLTLSSGEPYDLIFAPDWLNYWQNAAKGAFAEISDEELQKNAPYIWANNQDSLNTTKYKGIRYGVAGTNRIASDRGFVARGDLMDKYNIPDLNSKENLEAYLTAVAENEPDMIPFDLEGNKAYLMPAMFAPDWDWIPVGSVSYGEPIYFHRDDPEHKLFIAAEQPEMLELTETMNRWRDKGFFSKSVMSNKTRAIDSFKSGRSALGLTESLQDCQNIWDELSADDRASWDIRFYPRYYNHQLTLGYNGNMVAISGFSTNKEAALKVLNAMYESPEVTRLVNYGIEGTHYEITEGNRVKVLDAQSFGWINTGICNGEATLKPELSFPGCDEMEKKFDDMKISNPASNCPLSDEGIREIKLALNEVYDQYTSPRYYGIINGTPEEALKTELAALKTAGIEQYMQSIQSQLDEYLREISE